MWRTDKTACDWHVLVDKFIWHLFLYNAIQLTFSSTITFVISNNHAPTHENHIFLPFHCSNSVIFLLFAVLCWIDFRIYEYSKRNLAGRLANVTYTYKTVKKSVNTFFLSVKWMLFFFFFAFDFFNSLQFSVKFQNEFMYRREKKHNKIIFFTFHVG